MFIADNSLIDPLLDLQIITL